MIKGCDVSGWNTGPYDFSPYAFVMIKATQGLTFVNPYMSAQAAAARKQGKIVGFYHFQTPTDDPVKQVAWFTSKCLSVAGDILADDWENLSPTVAGPTCAEKDAFLAELERVRPTHRNLLYCNRDYWLNRDTTSKCGDGLWIADPSGGEGTPRVQHPWVLDQYSISGAVDLDVANFSTVAEMKAWATGKAGLPAPTPSPKPSGEGADSTSARDGAKIIVRSEDASTSPE